MRHRLGVPSHFVLRRLHSLAGLIPLTFFILSHLYFNSKSLGPDGVVVYNRALESLAAIPFYVVFECLFIFVPLLFHVGYGFVLLSQGSSNIVQYGYEGNIRYWFQRATGILGVLFVGYHIYATRLTSVLTSSPMDYLWMVRLFEDSWRVWFYLVGSTAVFFHLANGIWISLIVWGVTASHFSQRLSLYTCMSLFVLGALINSLIIVNFTFHYEAAPGWLDAILRFVKNYLFR